MQAICRLNCRSVPHKWSVSHVPTRSFNTFKTNTQDPWRSAPPKALAHLKRCGFYGFLDLPNTVKDSLKRIAQTLLLVPSHRPNALLHKMEPWGSSWRSVVTKGVLPTLLQGQRAAGRLQQWKLRSLQCGPCSSQS